MHTLSAGQATRASFRIASDVHTSFTHPRTQAGALHPSVLVLLAETAFAALAYALAVLLLAEAREAVWPIDVLRSTLAVAALAGAAGSAIVRLHRRSLRHPCALDVFSIFGAATLNTVFLGAAVRWQFPQLDIRASVLVVDAMLLCLFWCGLHFGARIWRTQRAARRSPGKRAVIVGAGDAGISLLKELALDPASPCRPVALVDDDARKWGLAFYGIRVLGGTKNLATIAAETKADELLICIPSATHSQMHDVLDAARRSNLPVRSLPSLAELLLKTNAGKVSPRDLRNPQIEHLLQREQIRVDAQETHRIVAGKVVLVTGAGGSIGSELCRQIAAARPRRLLLLDKSENSLFYVHSESSECLGADRVKPFLADLGDSRRIRTILRAEKPDVVFHAAAHKHVAMLERQPLEAIRNNVLGTRNIAAAALEWGADRFVNISTDKAVAPSNYMGLSKKLTEMCIQEFARSAALGTHTHFSNVRFGNVAGSTGSVLRLFWDQIQKGRPVRVTDPRATRYFMSVSEAVQLILRAASLGRGGDTFVFDMGAPLNIYELAKTMMLFSGLKPHVDLPIEFTGLGEGEKISEQLWEEWEHPVAAGCNRILVIRERDVRARGILAKVQEMEGFIARDDAQGLLDYLRDVFPEFRGQPSDHHDPPARESAPEISAMTSVGVG